MRYPEFSRWCSRLSTSWRNKENRCQSPIAYGRNHPCTRGADIKALSEGYVFSEPPMHTRGRRSDFDCAVFLAGTTHAHAGQTGYSHCTFCSSGNHPCTRGADAAEFWLTDLDGEPPMHTRGRHLLTRYNARMSAKLYSVACIMQ